MKFKLNKFNSKNQKIKNENIRDMSIFK